MKIFIYQNLEHLFEILAGWAERQRERFAICPNCGQNRYTGKPCS